MTDNIFNDNKLQDIELEPVHSDYDFYIVFKEFNEKENYKYMEHYITTIVDNSMTVEDAWFSDSDFYENGKRCPGFYVNGFFS